MYGRKLRQVRGPRIHAEIETIINDLQERFKAHDKCLVYQGVKMGEFSYASFGDLKDELLK